jgi:hypothetical protein
LIIIMVKTVYFDPIYIDRRSQIVFSLTALYFYLATGVIANIHIGKNAIFRYSL